MAPGPERRVAVIGGGITGLAAAWELATESLSTGARPAVSVTVFEGDERVGGKLRTGTIGGRPVDLGPDAFVARRTEGLALCRELGIEKELVPPGVRRAYVWARGRLRPLPAGLALGVPTRLGPLARSGICSPVGLARASFDLLRTGGAAPGRADSSADRAVGPVVRRRLGAEVTARLAGPLIGGIHAGTVDDMSAAAVFPALLEADGRPGSLMRALRATIPAPPAQGEGPPVFLALRGGMGRLADVLRHGLEQRGVDVRVGDTVTALERSPAVERPAASEVAADGQRWVVHGAAGACGFDAVVVAVPAPAAAGLVRAHSQALADGLAAISYASVALITLRVPAAAVGRPLDGSGFLVPRGEGGRPDPLVTACTWLSVKWPELSRDGDLLLRASVGRQGDTRHDELDDDELVRRCVAELAAMMGLTGHPLEAVVTRWPLAFPQYAVGHLARVTAIEEAAAGLPSLAVAGAALHGVGIPACIGSGRRAARAILAG